MRFVCDVMLGKLAKYLRILGLDTIYVRSMDNLAGHKINDETPYFFTKRRLQKILYSNPVYIKADDVIGQLREINNLIAPHVSERDLMSRCIGCNAVLREVNKDDVESLVPEFVFHKYNVFKACPSCKKIYWKGSHVEHMIAWIREMKGINGRST